MARRLALEAFVVDHSSLLSSAEVEQLAVGFMDVRRRTVAAGESLASPELTQPPAVASRSSRAPMIGWAKRLRTSAFRRSRGLGIPGHDLPVVLRVHCSRREIQAFYGALAGQRANKGVVITTSGYTTQAIEVCKIYGADRARGWAQARRTDDRPRGGGLYPHRQGTKLDSDHFDEEST